MKFSHFWTP